MSRSMALRVDGIGDGMVWVVDYDGMDGLGLIHDGRRNGA